MHEAEGLVQSLSDACAPDAIRDAVPQLDTRNDALVLEEDREPPGAGGGDEALEDVLGQSGLRLNKVLSRAGLGSRRAVETLVRQGRVAVDGEVVRDLARRVDPTRERVLVDGSLLQTDPQRRYWLLNKPHGVLTTCDDPQGRPTVLDLVPQSPRVFPVGRLDMDSEGLLLLTNDGDLTYRLTHASFGVRKHYVAMVERLPSGALAQLRAGIELDGVLARPVSARRVASAGTRQSVEIVLVEGRNREVRRLLAAVGAPVSRLVRTRIGPLRLEGLAPGECRSLQPEELRSLYRAVRL